MEVNHPKIALTMMYWNLVDPSRLANLQVSARHLIRLANYLRDQGFKVRLQFWDFSSEEITESFLPEDIPIKRVIYSKDEYKRSEKINVVLQDNADSDYFCMLDGDMSIMPRQLPEFLKIFQELKNTEYHTFRNWYTRSRKCVINNEIDETKITGKISEWTPGLGGFFIVPTKKLIQIGGFDERFIQWSWEDHDIAYRLSRLGLTKIQNELCLYHMHHPRPAVQLNSDPVISANKRMAKRDLTTVRTSKILAINYSEQYEQEILKNYDQII